MERDDSSESITEGDNIDENTTDISVENEIDNEIEKDEKNSQD